MFIGVQPTFGYEGDPMRLLFSRSASPHHGFAAYYTFLERIFQARPHQPREQGRCKTGGLGLGLCRLLHLPGAHLPGAPAQAK